MYHILYNPKACNKRGEASAKKIEQFLPKEELSYENSLEVGDYRTYLNGFPEGDTLVLCGGDGTLNYFINHTEESQYKMPILFFGSGTGNDFLTDIGKKPEDGPVELNPYLKGLPTVTVKGKTYKFINGIGYGIDGYCCEVADKKQEKSDKPVNYTNIAIGGILFHFKSRDAKITVDGVTKEFKKAWLAPCMHGRFFGGGMMACPDQKRLAGDGKLSVMTFYGKGRLKTLTVFPSIFKGEHVKHTDMVEVLTGHVIKVEFAEPCALQIDGETILNVSSYEARGAE